MDFQSIYVGLVILFMLWALIADRMRPGLILFTAVVMMLCAGILTPKEALEGFSNRGMITVALLYLVSEGVRKSGILEALVTRLLPSRNVTLSRSLLRFLPTISFVSAFLNNTPVVVIFAPVVKRWAKKMRMEPAKFLIPLSYATILGGMCTLVGTSTNIVLNGLVSDGIAEGLVKDGHPLAMFELGKVGVLITLAGLFYLIFVSRYLLPSVRNGEAEDGEEPSSPDVVRVEALLSTRFPGLGKTLREFDFYRHYGATVRCIRRSGELLGGDWLNTPLDK
ncbi:MAG TPA: sodium:solute symporter, partial [Prevotellaceae bacterium]|nr:sodium:solute symporter [Prevotellaceae bacterium]